MRLTELMNSIQFVVDSAGNRTAVQLDLAIWEELITLLEDLEDAADLQQARQEADDLIPWEQVVSEYQATHPEVDV